MSETIATAAVTAWLRAFAAAVAERRDELTELDAAIGDADHGVNMDRGMQAVVARLEADGQGPAGPGVTVGALLKTAGMTLVSTVGGAAGPLYGTFFLRMAAAAGDRTELTAAGLAEALAAGVEGVRARGFQPDALGAAVLHQDARHGRVRAHLHAEGLGGAEDGRFYYLRNPRSAGSTGNFRPR